MSKKIIYLPLGMAPPTVHLKVAKEVAEIMGIKLNSQYLLGAIAPDAVMARIDYTADSINDTHYKKEGLRSGWDKAVDLFSQADDPFDKGYNLHIMVDVLWLTGVMAKLKEKHGEDFDIKIYREDIDFVEKWLCRTEEYLQLWNAISGAKLTAYNIYISSGEMDLYKSQKYKSIVYERVVDNMIYLSMDDIGIFAKKAAKRIMSATGK